MHECTHTYMHATLHACKHTHIHKHECLHTCTYACMLLCVYTQAHTRKRRWKRRERLTWRQKNILPDGEISILAAKDRQVQRQRWKEPCGWPKDGPPVSSSGECSWDSPAPPPKPCIVFAPSAVHAGCGTPLVCNNHTNILQLLPIDLLLWVSGHSIMLHTQIKSILWIPQLTLYFIILLFCPL